MRSARPATSARYFLGVRLSFDELGRIDEFQRTRGIATRSDAVRVLVRESGGSPGVGAKLPVSLNRELEEAVEDGWARDYDEVLTLVLTLGVGELSRLHTDRVPGLRHAARQKSDRAERRRSADRDGREMLEG